MCPPPCGRVTFQSTLPVWGATIANDNTHGYSQISIHAPRVGSDGPPRKGLPPGRDFNPRSPCGERRCTRPLLHPRMVFQSTLPVWGATIASPVGPMWNSISIHAPRVGSDALTAANVYEHIVFQSTLPVWGATI